MNSQHLESLKLGFLTNTFIISVYSLCVHMCVYVMLKIELRTLNMLVKHSTTKISSPVPTFFFFFPFLLEARSCYLAQAGIYLRVLFLASTSQVLGL